MKKIISVMCVLVLLTALLAGCGAAPENAPSVSAPVETAVPGTAETAASAPVETIASVDVNVMALKGPTAMGMVRFMEQADSGAITDNRYKFTIAAAVDEVTPKLVQGGADIAAVPANLASVLYNNTKGGVRVLAVNTLGVIYIVERGTSVSGIEDLRGKTIYASGKGATPEYALNYILGQNGIDPATDVTIEWKSEHAECLAALLAQENAIAMLPQPFVTTAQAKNEDIRVALDLTQEWDALGTESALITGVIVARTEFVEKNPDAVSAFMEHYRESVDYVNGNIEEAAKLVGSYDIVPEQIAQKALPACNITCIEGEQMREKLSGYLAVLMEQEPKSVGGALPGDNFYFIP